MKNGIRKRQTTTNGQLPTDKFMFRIFRTILFFDDGAKVD